MADARLPMRLSSICRGLTVVSVLALIALMSLAGTGFAQNKIESLILVPASMKAYVEQMPKSFPFVTNSNAQSAKVVVGGLDAAKKEPDARFILQLHSLTYIPAKKPLVSEINRLEYSLYYRSADAKQGPTLLTKRTIELGRGNPK